MELGLPIYMSHTFVDRNLHKRRDSMQVVESWSSKQTSRAFLRRENLSDDVERL